MKFMLMINVPYATGEYQHQEYSAAAWKAHSQFNRDLNRSLIRSGEFVQVHALQPPGRTRIVRHADGQAPVIPDGKPCGMPIEVREVMWSPSPEELG